MILLLLILIALYFGKTLFPSSSQIIYGGDLLTQFYFWKGYLVENLKSGIIPFWNPYLFSGTPFLAHPGTSFFYPGTLLFILLPLNFAFSWNYFLHAIIGGIGVIYLVKRYTSDRIAILLSACLFVLSGYFAARIYAGHVDLFTTAVWIPWVLWSFQRYLESKEIRKLWLPTLFITLEILAGYQAYVLFTFELLFAYTVYHTRFKKLLLSLLPIIFAVLISAIQWLPTAELSRLSIRGRGLPYELATWGSLPVSALRLFFLPLDRNELNKISFNLGGGPLPNPFDHFIGGLSIIFIIGYILIVFFGKIFKLKIAIWKVGRDFWFFLLISLVFLWISMAFYVSPNLHGLLYRLVPFYRFIRIPLQHLIIPVVLVPVMVGLLVSKIGNKILKLALFFMFIAELIIFDRQYLFLTKLPEDSYNPQLINVLRDNLKGDRFLPNYRVVSPLVSSLDLNASLKYKFYSTSGYDPVILDNYYSFIDSSNGSDTSSILYYNVEIPPIKLKDETLRFLNIRYILEEKDNSWSLRENNEVRPRYFLENGIDDKSCLTDLTNQVKEEERSINKVRLKVTTDCPATLSSSEVYYPGWKAEVDGKKADIVQNNLAFRSINLPSGTHMLNFYYQPDIYYLGGGISLLGISGLIIVMRMRKNYE